MAATRTLASRPTLTASSHRQALLRCAHRHAVRIGMRVGDITQKRAEECLKREMAQIDLDLAHRAKWRAPA